MGVTITGTTVSSRTVASDDDIITSRDTDRAAIGSVAFNSFGTGPSAVISGGRVRVVAGTGVPAAGANSVVITAKQPVKAVYLKNTGATPFFYVSSISGSTVNIGTQAAAAASSTHDLDVIIIT